MLPLKYIDVEPILPLLLLCAVLSAVIDSEFVDNELECGESKVKILKPVWIS